MVLLFKGHSKNNEATQKHFCSGFSFRVAQYPKTMACQPISPTHKVSLGNHLNPLIRVFRWIGKPIAIRTGNLPRDVLFVTLTHAGALDLHVSEDMQYFPLIIPRIYTHTGPYCRQ